MMFNDLAPTHDEQLVYDSIVRLRDLALASQHSVIIDSTAPNNETREFLMGEGKTGRSLLVVMDVDRKILQERANATNKSELLRAYEDVWEEPNGNFPVFKFRNNNKEDFETGVYLLIEYLSNEHPHHNSIFRDLLRRRKEKQITPVE